MKKPLEKIKNEFEEVVNVIDKKFGKDYSVKNPGLVQHLLDKIQQQEDRIVHSKIHIK